MGLTPVQNTQSSDDDGVDAPIMAEINVTPLVDVMLVLLIIFMVTSSVMSQLGVDVTLPQASQAIAEAQPDGVIVTLLPSGEFKVNEHRFKSGQWSEFERTLQAAFEQAKSKLVVLEGDQKAFLGSVVEVMDHARKAGAERFAIATAGGGS